MDEDTTNWLTSPVEVIFADRGDVDSILTDPDEPDFVVNIKKGLLSQIQQKKGGNSYLVLSAP